jgi:hypothetical protein
MYGAGSVIRQSCATSLADDAALIQNAMLRQAQSGNTTAVDAVVFAMPLRVTVPLLKADR